MSTRTEGEAPAITDEAIERLRARIGVPEPHPMPPHYTLPTVDTFRNVAEAYGDDNPLWCDPAYGPTTRWEGPIAPPALVGGDTLVGLGDYGASVEVFLPDCSLRRVRAKVTAAPEPAVAFAALAPVEEFEVEVESDRSFGNPDFVE